MFSMLVSNARVTILSQEQNVNIITLPTTKHGQSSVVMRFIKKIIKSFFISFKK